MRLFYCLSHVSCAWRNANTVLDTRSHLTMMMTVLLLQSIALEVILDNEYLKITMAQRASDNVVFCFTGIGHAMGGIDVQREEFYRITDSATTIFLIDKERSWGNNIDFDELKTFLRPYIEGKTLYALGNSMGGFLAVIASHYFDFESVVAFVPQYSVNKAVVPEEDRFDEYVNHISNWQFESLDGFFNDETEYYVFNDTSSYENAHMKWFPELPNLHKIVVKNPEWNHRSAAMLKEMGVLYDCILGCFEKQSAEAIKRIITAASPSKIAFVDYGEKTGT